MSIALRWVVIIALLPLTSSARAAGLPNDCEQLILALAPGWDSFQGTLQRFERSDGGPWKRVGEAVPVLFGKNGLAWGRGLAGQNQQGLHKHEHDGRAPAGIFRIGKIYTYDPALPAGADFPFHQVTKADAWIDDPVAARLQPLSSRSTTRRIRRPGSRRRKCGTTTSPIAGWSRSATTRIRLCLTMAARSSFTSAAA